MLVLLSALVCSSLLAVSCRNLHAADDILIADFEGKDYGGWKVEGTAFGDGPARGTLPGQMHVDGFRGKGLVNSFLGGDNSTGTLTSPSFKIRRDFINFLVGGGMHAGKTCMDLIVEGKVVRTVTGPNDLGGGSERLAWAGWNVKNLKGKEATLRIVDRQKGGWGHINIDHIVQSDKKVEVAPGSREIALDKKYLLFPICNTATHCRIIMTIDGKRVHDFDIQLASKKIDWWAYLDMTRHAGKTANLRRLPRGPQGLELIETANSLRGVEPLYDEALRPQFHFSQMRGWHNDVNGTVFYDGEYHLFWQSNPFGWAWANMYWGHAVSKDLVHWKELPTALYPRTMAKGACFSGSANIDSKNTGGWQTGAEKVMVAAFTDTGSGEALAISNDRGRTWKYVDENPIIRHNGRDPKLVWYEYGEKDTPLNDEAKRNGGHWVIAVFDITNKPVKKQEDNWHIAFYVSSNLKRWRAQSRVTGYGECPELFKLPVDGNADDTRWVVHGGDAQYTIGRFDGKTFTPEHKGRRRVHFGNYYASQCFSRAPGDRVIQIGWARVETRGMPFNQMFTVPTELTLKTTEDGIRLCARPIKELETLRGKPFTTDTETLTPQKPIRLKTHGQLFDILVEVDPKDAKEIHLRFGRTLVRYQVAAAKLDEMPLPLVDGKVKFRVLVDRPMYEICGGEGDVYKTWFRADGGKPIDAIQLSAVGGAAKVETVKVYPMQSIWKKQSTRREQKDTTQ